MAKLRYLTLTTIGNGGYRIACSKDRCGYVADYFGLDLGLMREEFQEHEHAEFNRTPDVERVYPDAQQAASVKLVFRDVYGTVIHEKTMPLPPGAAYMEAFTRYE